MNKTKTINAQQIKFCHEYLIDYDAGSAAIRAGYNVAGAASKGCRLLRRPEVKAYLDELLAEQRQKYIATADKVLTELSVLAFSDISDFIDFRNDITDLRYVEQNKKRAISSMHISKTTSKNGNVYEHMYLKMHDKFAPLKLLVQQLGLLKEKETEREDYVKQIFVIPDSMGQETLDKKVADIQARDKEGEFKEEGTIFFKPNGEVDSEDPC